MSQVRVLHRPLDWELSLQYPNSKGILMANKDQNKRKAKSNQPKLTAKQKKEKKAKKAADDRNRYDA